MTNTQPQENLAKKNPGRRFLIPRLLLVVALVGLVLFVLFVHPFLAIDRPVKADTLVIEGWVPEYIVAKAAHEFQSGTYRKIFISGLIFEKNDPHFADKSDAVIITRFLQANGIGAATIEDCAVAVPAFNRTSHMARGVRDKMKALNYAPNGVNVVTLGPHARQTLVAYERMLGPLSPVGVISYPKNDYDPSRWWASTAGIKKTTKDFAGWLKEVLFGLRS